MIVDVFIRSYPKDFYLLNHCFTNIKRYLHGYRHIILCIRQKDRLSLQFSGVDLSNIQLIQGFNFSDDVDYCGQQISKLNADLSSDSEYILYIDSDCIFFDHVYIERDFFDTQRQMFLLQDEWKDVGDANCWQGCLKRLHILTSYEFMRRIPFMFPTALLRPIRLHIEKVIGLPFRDSCILIYKQCKFSEFNIMGSFAYLHHSNNINFIWSKDATVLPVKQFWSHTDKSLLLQDINRLLIHKNPSLCQT